MKCRVDGCRANHGDDQVCCRGHWFALPKAVRDEIWNLYRERPGSDEHREAVFNAIRFLDEKAKHKRKCAACGEAFAVHGAAAPHTRGDLCAGFTEAK